MKKAYRLLPSAVPFTLYLAGAQIASAQELCPPAWAALCSFRIESGNVFGRLITIFLVIAAVVSLIFLVWGGIRWITSNGDQQKVAQARSTLIASLVGLIISFMAYFIVGFVFQFMTGQNMSGSLSVPSLVP